MGHKVDPRAFRITTTYRTPSRWFASKKQYAKNVHVDFRLREMIETKFRDGGVARIEIERSAGAITLGIHSSKPGVIIGRGGAMIDELKKKIKKEVFGSEKIKLTVNIHEVQNPDGNAAIILHSIREQLEGRVRYRRAIKRTMENVMRSGAQGCKIQVAGRLNGSDIARTETISEGRLPLQTLRAKIDYAAAPAHTTTGLIGIKVWVFNGESFGDEPEEKPEQKRDRKHRKPRQPRKKKYDTGGQKKVLRKKSTDSAVSAPAK